MQSSIQISPAQRMKSRLLLAVGQIIGEKQWSIQKDLLHLRLGNAVLFQSNPVWSMRAFCICLQYTASMEISPAN
jgi:hypothetical protein